ncbi:MAG: class I SAM-dependent methyltransferase [Pyrinomonadaceae bacterium]|nr:class I SAM-dependent methyltransferase [Pyrinomonadaceae bacterium]MBP6212188.1 class I SAM-dependent methyltransferase [Pyrinomonadaceae bacterium]
MESAYDLTAKYYDTALRPLERLFLASARKETIAFLPENATILEVGAGTGANFQHYPKCRHSVASELSIGMLGKSLPKAAGITLVQADAQLLPFPANHFDAAFATLVFCSISEPALAFAELIRVVRPGGRVILLEHVRPSGILGYVFDALSKMTVAMFDDHFNRRTAVAAERAGLRVIEVRKKVFGIVNLIVTEVPVMSGEV